MNVKTNYGGNIFATFAGTITPRKYSTGIVHHVVLVSLNLAIDSLWNFLTALLQAVLGDHLQDLKGSFTTQIPQQGTAETSKQVHMAAITKLVKKRGNGHFNTKTST